MSKPFKYREGVTKIGKPFISVGKWDKESKKYKYIAYSSDKAVKKYQKAEKKQKTAMRKREEYTNAWNRIKANVLAAGGTRTQAMAVYKASRGRFDIHGKPFSKRASRDYAVRHTGNRTSIQWFYQYSDKETIPPNDVGESPGEEGEYESGISYASFNSRFTGNSYSEYKKMAVSFHRKKIQEHEEGKIFLWYGSYTVAYYNAETGKNLIRPATEIFRG